MCEDTSCHLYAHFALSPFQVDWVRSGCAAREMLRMLCTVWSLQNHDRTMYRAKALIFGEEKRDTYKTYCIFYFLLISRHLTFVQYGASENMYVSNVAFSHTVYTVCLPYSHVWIDIYICISYPIYTYLFLSFWPLNYFSFYLFLSLFFFFLSFSTRATSSLNFFFKVKINVTIKNTYTI